MTDPTISLMPHKIEEPTDVNSEHRHRACCLKCGKQMDNKFVHPDRLQGKLRKISGLSPACIGQIVTVTAIYPTYVEDNREWNALLRGYTIMPEKIVLFFHGIDPVAIHWTDNPDELRASVTVYRPTLPEML